MEKLDKKDLRILYALEFNARMPVSEVAKSAGISVQLAKYRLDNLFRKGVIRRTTAIIDPHRLGFFTYRLYLRLQNATDEDESRLIVYLVSSPYTIWVVSASGNWDVEVVFLAKNPVRVDLFIREMKNQFGNLIQNYVISPSTANYHFGRAYFVEGAEKKEKIPFYGSEPSEVTVDQTDLGILALLVADARMPVQEIAHKLGISFNTVKQHVKGLESSGVLQSYRTFLDLEKVGLEFYKAIITTRSFSDADEKKMLSFCMSEREIVYFVECFGGWNLEIEAEVVDEADFRGIMKRFRNKFGDVLQNYEILHIYREHKLNYFPVAAQLLKAKTRTPKP